MASKRSNGEGSRNLFQGKAAKMPEGYYSGDKPNPNLRAFVEAHVRERPYDPEEDKYDVEAFDQALDATKATAIYNMHSYHQGKKPHDAIRTYIRHYTKPGDLVLDPFCGSGSTALAALMEGRKAIAVDRSPAATFITKNHCTPVDPDELRLAFEELELKVKPEIDWLYETQCDRCGGSATTDFTVYSEVFECPRCMERVPLFDCVEMEGETAAGNEKKVRVCPHCYKRGHTELISTRSRKFGAVPVLVSYLCSQGCRPARAERRHNDPGRKKREYFESYDLAKLEEIERREIPHWYPRDRMMHAPENQQCWGVKWRAGTSNFRTIDELFTKRNLWALAAIRAAVVGIAEPVVRDAGLFAMTGVILGMSRMNQYRPDVTFPTSIMKGTYYLPQIAQEEPPLQHFLKKIERLARGYHEIGSEVTNPQILVSTMTATDMDMVPPASVDYIFTDPPYGDRVQYGELNFVWEAWLGVDTHWHDDEIIVNPVRGKSEEDWARLMSRAMAECYRVLRPGRWLSLCYHDTSEGTWAKVQDIMAEAGFVADRQLGALFIDAREKSYNQLMADKVTKRDLVINYRKPRPGEVTAAVVISGDEDRRTFAEKARAVIQRYLESHPGAPKDRIYDHLVSHMVRRGAMEPHDFESLLVDVAEEVREPRKKDLFEDEQPDLFGAATVSRWYLKETALAVVDAAETAKEDAAAASLSAFIAEVLRKQPELEGVHYSDLFEHYLYAVRDKPRRELKDWLGDYFLKTAEGTWRLPADPEEEQAKAEARASGISRRVRRFLALLDQGVPIATRERPSSATVAEWIRHCKRAGLYEEGKRLFEQGGLVLDQLSEEAQVAAEEDYQVCVRGLAKVETRPTRRKRKSEPT